MENKQKILIATLTFILFVVLFWCIWNKPKKYVKQQTIEKEPEETETNEETETETVVETSKTETKEPIVETITAADCAARLYNSMLGHGTDTRALLECFDLIDTDEEFDDVMQSFEEQTGQSFDAILSNEIFTAKIVANKINNMLVSKGIDRMITIEE